MKTDNLLVPGGQGFLGAYRPGTRMPNGIESDWGNIKTLTHSKTVEKLQHRTSKSGKLRKDRVIETSAEHTLTLVTDNMSMDTMALRFGGEVVKEAQAESIGVMETLTGIPGNSYIQLGLTDTNLFGVRFVTVTSVMVNGMDLTAEVDFLVFADEGRLYFPEGVVAEDDEVIVNYDVAPAEREILVASGTTIEAPIRFIGRSPDDLSKPMDVYIPCGLITAEGDMSIKNEGDAFAEATFTIEVIELDGRAPVYIDGKAAKL